MSNRHERRRSARLVSIRMMSVAELSKMESICAWSSCLCCTADPDKDGWSKLVLYRGRTKSDFMDISQEMMDRDAVLCPDHAEMLHKEMLKSIPGFNGFWNAQPTGIA